MIKAIIFDMDGTLLYTLSDLARSVNYGLEQMGFPLRTEDEVRSFIGNGVSTLLRRACPAGTTDADHAAALEHFRTHYAAHSRVDTRPYEGINELLHALKEKNIKTAIVSNKNDEAVRELNEVFFGVDTAIGESGRCRRKPAPDMVLMALSELGVAPGEAAYAGDSEVDLQTAENSGCLPILVTWGYRSRSQLKALGDHILVDSPAEILTLPQLPQD